MSGILDAPAAAVGAFQSKTQERDVAITSRFTSSLLNLRTQWRKVKFENTQRKVKFEEKNTVGKS